MGKDTYVSYCLDTIAIQSVYQNYASQHVHSTPLIGGVGYQLRL